MSDGKVAAKVISSSCCCPPSAEDLIERIERARREDLIERIERARMMLESEGSERKGSFSRTELMKALRESAECEHCLKDEFKVKDPPIYPLLCFGLGDEDHPGESTKLEAPMKTEGKERVFVVLGDEVWESEEPEPKSPPRRMQMEVEQVDEEEPELEKMEPGDASHWMTVSQYRIHWNERWSGYYGSFEDTTRIPPMRFTDNAKAVQPVYIQRNTLQVYSVKLAATRGNLQLPLDVFGMVAVRDPVDHNRNFIFLRKRDECHTLTEKDPYLVLEGPTRAVMFSEAKSDPVIIEVDLKVKGAFESEDKYLSFLVHPLTCSGTHSRVFKRAYTSKLSRLEFMLGHVAASVEATIFVRVVHGSWPDGLRGLFTASTTGCSGRSTTEFSSGVGHERIILLDSRDQEVPVAGDGKIKLSRNVVSTENHKELIFQVKALEGDTKVVGKDIIFHPLEENKSIIELDIGFCKMEVTVFWSRVSDYTLEEEVWNN